MLNPKAMPAASGAGLADYLWKEAVGQDADPVLAIAAQHKVEAEEAYRHTLASIREGLLRGDNVNAAAIVDRIGQLTEFDWEGFDGAINELRVAGLNISARMISQARAELENSDDIGRALEAAGDPDTIRTFGVAYRGNTSPELADLLRIDLDSLPQLQDLKHLLSGGTSDGQQPEGKRRYRTSGDRKTMGSLQLIFSADKSVSVVFGLGSPEEREAISGAQRQAVDAAMQQIAERLGHLRSRRDGLDRQDPADLTWIQWQHRMSRRGDPQLHTHITIPNVVRSRVDGKVGTLDTFALHGLYPSVRETYHRALADALRKLDLPVAFDPKLCAAILTNVPEQVLRHFSGRTADAEAWLLAKYGVNFGSLTPHQRSTWLGHAAAKTRPPKAMYYVAGNGHSAWHARAAGQGYVPPPQFVSPQALQRAGVTHASGRSLSQTQQQQSRAIRPQLDARYNRGGGHYDDTGHKHGRSL